MGKNTSGFSLKTTDDNFASIEHERVLIEFSKDGDSPNCPRSWTWSLWFDGQMIESDIEETSLASAVKNATRSINDCACELLGMQDWLEEYGAFGMEPEEEETY